MFFVRIAIFASLPSLFSRYASLSSMEGPKLPEVFNLESYITPSTLANFFSRKYLDTSLYHIRAPYRNERIVLPDPPPSGLIDPQKDLSLVFLIKQRDYGLTFPFTPFFTEVF